MSRCSQKADGLLFCWDHTRSVPGWKSLGIARGDPHFGLFRRSDDPLLHTGANGQGAAAPQEGREKEPLEKPARNDWFALARAHAEALTIEQAEAFADHLGLPVRSIECLQLLGFWQDSRAGKTWTWPAFNGRGEIIGLWRRNIQGQKWMAQGGNGGLIPNRQWEEMTGPLFLVEGTSNVCALHALGLRAIGVHTAGFGAEMLAEMLSAFPGDEQITVLADYELKRDGSTPGLTGATKLAQQLADLLGRDLNWSFPPHTGKDARDFVKLLYGQSREQTDWPSLRNLFLSGLQPQGVICRPASTADEDHSGLDTQPFSQVIPEALNWLIPPYFARGKLHIIAGPGGVGKSRWTYDFAARMSRGQPWGGLGYQPPGPMPVLLANCEDGHRDTISPCLYAAGADMEMVRRLIAAVEPDGKSVRFSLTNLRAIEAYFRRFNRPGWLIIDPVGSFTGGGGFDAFRESDVKGLLDPLVEILERWGWTAILVMHLNKGSGRKAIDRLMNSVAFGNTARAVYGLYESPDDEDGREFLPMKYNMGKCPKGRSYVIRDLYASEQDQVGDLLADKVTPDTWLKLAPQLSRLDGWRECERTAEQANADDDHPMEDLPEVVRSAEQYLRQFLDGGPQHPQDCREHVSTHLHQEVSLKWLRIRVFYERLHGVLLRIPGQPPTVMCRSLPGKTLS